MDSCGLLDQLFVLLSKKNSCANPGFTAFNRFVLKLPLPLNTLVQIGVQVLKGAATFVLVNR
jgi:hypothetical protein